MNDNILLILMLIALCVLIFRLPEIIRAIKQPSQVSRCGFFLFKKINFKY